jgi:hypothetical protein
MKRLTSLPPPGARSSPGFASVVQSVWDHLRQGTKLLLILTGSTVGTIQVMMGPGGALRGRPALQGLRGRRTTVVGAKSGGRSHPWGSRSRPGFVPSSAMCRSRLRNRFSPSGAVLGAPSQPSVREPPSSAWRTLSMDLDRQRIASECEGEGVRQAAPRRRPVAKILGTAPIT